MCEKQNSRTKASVHMYDSVTCKLSTYITHLCEAERQREKNIRAGFKVVLLMLLWASHQTEWRSKHLGSRMKDEGWTFPGMKATQQKLCAHTDHIAVFFLWTVTNALYCTSAHTADSLFKRCRRSISAFKKNFVKISVSVLGCLS